MLIESKLFFSFDELTATAEEIKAEGGDAPSVISPSLSEEIARTPWDLRALPHFSALHGWVLIQRNTKRIPTPNKSKGQSS